MIDDEISGDMKGGDMEVPEAVRIAMGKANEYKKNKGFVDNSSSIVEDSKLIGIKWKSFSLD